MIRSDITLGILAGGRATRLDGIDKAWLERDGQPQVLRLARRFAPEVAATLVSANRDCARYAEHGLLAVADRIANAGPLGGLDALTHACATQWLLSLPVDLIGVNECLLQTLAAGAATSGAFAEDDDGPQPLVALWRVGPLRGAVDDAVANGEFAVHDLHARLGTVRVRLAGVRFGNLNTMADLAAAGMMPPA